MKPSMPEYDPLSYNAHFGLFGWKAHVSNPPGHVSAMTTSVGMQVAAAGLSFCPLTTPSTDPLPWRGTVRGFGYEIDVKFGETSRNFGETRLIIANYVIIS